MHLTLQNKYNELVLLTPLSNDKPETGTYYNITLRNIKDKIVKQREIYVYQDPRKGSFFLEPLQTRKYVLDLSLWSDSVYSVEIRLHVEVHHIKKNIHYINEKDIIKTFLWE